MESFNSARRELLKFGGMGLAAAATTLPASAYAATKSSIHPASGIFDVRTYGCKTLTQFFSKLPGYVVVDNVVNGLNNPMIKKK